MIEPLNPILFRPEIYLDPGSGSFLIQLLLAAVLGIGVAARLYWRKIKSLFGGKKPGAGEPGDEDDEQ